MTNLQIREMAELNAPHGMGIPMGQAGEMRAYWNGTNQVAIRDGEDVVQTIQEVSPSRVYKGT